jgi:hypothetical protein
MGKVTLIRLRGHDDLLVLHDPQFIVSVIEGGNVSYPKGAYYFQDPVVLPRYQHVLVLLMLDGVDDCCDVVPIKT